MSTYERSVFVAAPFETVWDFHATVEGLLALTPDWVNLRVEAVTGPDGEPDPAVLEAGSRIRMAARPLGVGPEQTWTSVITEREQDPAAGTAHFQDVMEGGPMASWRHTHRFRAVDGGTLLTDHVEYRLPGGRLGGLASPAAVVGFEPAFRYRHRRTRELLETGPGPAAAPDRTDPGDGGGRDGESTST